MEQAELGATGMQVSKVGFGTGPIGGVFGAVTDQQAIAIVHEAIDLGINLIDTSPFYGNAEERLGKALVGRRDRVVVGTKAGRYGSDDFDFSPERIRSSLENSLRLLRTDYVDLLQLHDIEFVPLGPVFEDSYAALLTLRDEGKCRFVGMTGYALPAMVAALTRTELDVLLVWSHATLLDDSLQRVVAPVAREGGTGLINAAAVALGLLTPAGDQLPKGHPATPTIRAAATRMGALCRERGVDLADIANQYSIQRSGCATTLIGTATSSHLYSAIHAADAPIDEELLADLIALRPPPDEQVWVCGLPENNTHV